MSSTLDSALNTGIPILLLVIALGFIYVKFLKPYVLPLLQNIYEWLKGKQEEVPQNTVKELTFE